MGSTGFRRLRAAAICFLFCGLVWVYGLPMGLLLYTRWQARNSPVMWVVPTPLPVVSVKPSGGRSFSYFGYEFEAPWTELKRERKLESIAVLNFSNGAVISFLDPTQTVSGLDAMKQEASRRGTDVRNIFGEQATRSNYALLSRILCLTPRDLKLSFSRQEMAGDSVLLTLKTIQTTNIKGGIYSFQTEWLHGFQKGRPETDKMVMVEAFDKQDRDVEVWIGAENGANKPSQSDIDRILFSLRPVLAVPKNKP